MLIDRFDVFGFPDAPGMDPDELNLGFLDQRLAFEWARFNIGNFCGEVPPSLFGPESAGATSFNDID